MGGHGWVCTFVVPKEGVLGAGQLGVHGLQLLPHQRQLHGQQPLLHLGSRASVGQRRGRRGDPAPAESARSGTGFREEWGPHPTELGAQEGAGVTAAAAGLSRGLGRDPGCRCRAGCTPAPRASRAGSIRTSPLGGSAASRSLARARGMEKQPGCPPSATCLIVPANDKVQVVHKLLESLVLSKEALGAARDIRLLLEVQVLHLPQNGHDLRAAGDKARQ